MHCIKKCGIFHLKRSFEIISIDSVIQTKTKRYVSNLLDTHSATCRGFELCLFGNMDTLFDRMNTNTLCKYAQCTVLKVRLPIILC